MSDFDFDEIDRAVNGALNSDSTAPVVRPNTDQSDEPTSSASPATDSTEAATTDDNSSSEPRPATVFPAARRSSGRFMDVVHPSSDMRTRSTGFTPPRPQGAPTSFSAPAPVDAPSEPEITPTPDAMSFETNDGSSWDAPLESPFLPGAKVEKRPLGGIPAKDEQSLLSLLEDGPEELLLESPSEERLEATVMPDPIDFAAHAAALPSENEDTGVITPDLSDIPEPVADIPSDSIGDFNESADTTENVTDDETETTTDSTDEYQPVEVDEPELEQDDQPSEDSLASEAFSYESATPVEPETKPAEAPVVQAPSEPTGPTSITQQYTEQPSAEQTSGAIYDTEAYHKPIVPVVKKKSGVWTILWIMLLVILGAGAGVAVYLFVLPLL